MKTEGNKLRGFTPGYLPEELGNQWSEKSYTREELIQIDTSALIKTFEKVVKSLDFELDATENQIYLSIYYDLKIS